LTVRQLFCVHKPSKYGNFNTRHLAISSYSFFHYFLLDAVLFAVGGVFNSEHSEVVLDFGGSYKGFFHYLGTDLNFDKY
jgi:hypothetical protein